MPSTDTLRPTAPKKAWHVNGYGPFARGPYNEWIWVVWAILAALGAIGVGQRILHGHLPAGYGSYVPWGLWIAVYFHAVGIATGSFLIGALGYVFGWRGLGTPSMLRAVVVLAAAAMFPAFLAVWLDLGHMERAHRMVTAPSFSSMMTFNAWMYMAFLGIAGACWLLSFRRRSEWLVPLLLAGAVFAVMIPSQSGAFLGVVHAKPFWHSPLLPVLFLASSVTAGAATLLVVRAALGPEAFGWAIEDPQREHDEAIDRLRLVVIGGVAVYVVLEWVEFSFGLWDPREQEGALALIVTGPYWWVFWIVHLAIGTALPLVLLGLSRDRRLWALAALLVAVTLLSARLNVLIPGQAVPELRGLEAAFQHPRLSYTYHATLMEYLVGCFLVAVGMAAFFLVRRAGAVLAFRVARGAPEEER